jgi:chromosome segregation ATPase
LQTELDRVADNTNKRDAQKTLVAQRKRDVDQLRKELDQSRDKTEEASKDLHRLSDEVMKIRLKLRDAIQTAEEREKAIRDLESFIRARERNSSKK